MEYATGQEKRYILMKMSPDMMVSDEFLATSAFEFHMAFFSLPTERSTMHNRDSSNNFLSSRRGSILWFRFPAITRATDGLHLTLRRSI